MTELAVAHRDVMDANLPNGSEKGCGPSGFRPCHDNRRRVPEGRCRGRRMGSGCCRTAGKHCRGHNDDDACGTQGPWPLLSKPFGSDTPWLASGLSITDSGAQCSTVGYEHLDAPECSHNLQEAPSGLYAPSDLKKSGSAFSGHRPLDGPWKRFHSQVLALRDCTS